MTCAPSQQLGADHRPLADREVVGREHDHVRGERGVRGERDVSVLAVDRRVAPDEDAVAERDAAVRRALRVERGAVVEDHALAEEDLGRMPQRDAAADRDLAPARAEERAVELRAQEEAERAGDVAEQELEDLHQDRLPARHRPVGDLEVLPRGRPAAAEDGLELRALRLRRGGRNRSNGLRLGVFGFVHVAKEHTRTARARQAAVNAAHGGGGFSREPPREAGSRARRARRAARGGRGPRGRTSGRPRGRAGRGRPSPHPRRRVP